MFQDSSWDVSSAGQKSRMGRLPSLHPALPRVMCPDCGGTMRLVQIEPSMRPGRAETSSFDWSCGFTLVQTVERYD